MLTLQEGRFGWDYRIANNDGEVEYIQSDWNYPATARTFGWNIRGVHSRNCQRKDSTDGTVDCASCGRTASEFIQAAGNYLDRNIGKRVQEG